MTRILFVYRNPIKFVLQDQEILKASFDVTMLRVKGARKHTQLIREISRHDVVFAWFGNWWAWIAALAARKVGKPSLIVGGGYDTVHVPEIRYGLMGHPLLGPIARSAFRNATRVTTFSKHSREQLLKHAGVDSKVIYCGVETAKYAPGSKKEPCAVTVGAVIRDNIRRKGLEYFVKAAAALPGIPFKVIGRCHPRTVRYLKRWASPNVEFLGYLPEEQLIAELQRAAVYVQASWHEGFGLALAEAMACECVPVVTARGAIPEVVGITGIYVPAADTKALAEGIREGLSRQPAACARARIVEHFPLQRRASELVELVESYAR